MQSRHRSVLAIGAAAGFALVLAGLYAGSNPDTFGHLAQGRQILALGRVPTHDSFSLLEPARRFVNYEWLADVLFALCDRAFGYDGILALKLVALGLTGVALVALGASIAGVRGGGLTALVIVASIPALRMRLSDRPHVLGIALAALTLFALDALGKSSRRRLPIAIGLFFTQILWVNLHGSHLLGTLMVGAFLLVGPPALRKSYACLLASHVLAASVSPYGPAIVTDALAHVFDPRYRALISEWQPWKTADAPWLQLGPVLHGMLLTLLAPRLLRAFQAARPHALLALALAIASFRSIRFIAEFLLLTAPLLGAGLSQVIPSTRARRFTWALSPVLLGAVFWGASVLPPDTGIGHGASYRDRPHGAGRWLAAHLPNARVFAAMEDGWFLMSELNGARFIVDGRSTFYGPDYLEQTALAFQDPAEMRRRLARDKIDAVVLRFTSLESVALVADIEKNAEFGRFLVENDHVLYVRRSLVPTRTPLRALVPAYDLTLLEGHGNALDADERSDLETIAQYPNTDAYRAFTSAVGALRALARPGAHDGIASPTTRAEWTLLQTAATDLAKAQTAAPDVPSVSALAALVYAVACQHEPAQDALARARAEGESRETLFAAQELAVRSGRTAEVAEFVRMARRDPRAAHDVWLDALERAAAAPPACPP